MSIEQIFVVGVQFSKVGKVYHFDASNIEDLKKGDSVIVETSRGWQLGLVVQVLGYQQASVEQNIKHIERRATPRDLLLRQNWQKKEADVVATSQQRVNAIGLNGIKIIAAEYSFDGTRLIVFFNSEIEEKVDLKSLKQDLQRIYSPAQIEVRQIGPRDVAKFYCGMGACGLEIRCCCKFLTDFNSISIRMAKEQDISLTPSEITGMCGRLRCCLIYEYEQYIGLRKDLPKRNKHVVTPLGEGRVVDVQVLRQVVMVELPEIGVREFSNEDLQIIDDNDRFIDKSDKLIPFEKQRQNVGKKVLKGRK